MQPQKHVHIKHHYAATALAVTFLIIVIGLVASKYTFANGQVSSGNAVINTYKTVQNSLNNKVSTLVQSVKSLSSSLNATNNTLSNYKSEVVDLQGKLSAAEAEASSLQNGAANYIAEIASLNSSLQAFNQTAQLYRLNNSYLLSYVIPHKNSLISSLSSTVSSLNSTLYQLDNEFLPTTLANLTTFPSSFNTTNASSFTRYSILLSASWNGSDVLMTGGNFTGYPIVALYNPVSKNLIDLSSELYSYKPWVVVSSVAGPDDFMIAYATPSNNTSTGYKTGLIEYINGKFVNLTSALSGSDFIPSGMAYDGVSYLIAGYYPNTTTQGPVSAALFSYSQKSGLISLTSYISNISHNNAFLSVAWDGSEYGILEANNNAPTSLSYHGSSASVVLYNPANNSFKLDNLTGLSNWGNGGIAWDGAKFLVVNAIGGGFTTSLFNPITNNYTNIYNTSGNIGGVPGEGLAWNGYEFFIPGLAANGKNAFLYTYS